MNRVIKMNIVITSRALRFCYSQIVLLSLVLASHSALATSDFDRNLAARCAYLTEIYARIANRTDLSELTTRAERDSAISLASYYRTANYFIIYSSSGEGDPVKTESIIKIAREKLAEELAGNGGLVAEGVAICKGHGERIIFNTQDKIDKWMGDGFFKKAYDFDVLFLSRDIAEYNGSN